jgi:hypothetical protein
MPLLSDENRIRELERKLNHALQDLRDLWQLANQALHQAQANSGQGAQGGQQPASSGVNPVRGAQTTSAISAGSGAGGSGSGTANLYLLDGTTTTAGPTGVTIYNSFTGTIPTATWVLVQQDDTGVYQVIAEQC